MMVSGVALKQTLYGLSVPQSSRNSLTWEITYAESQEDFAMTSLISKNSLISYYSAADSEVVSKHF